MSKYFDKAILKLRRKYSKDEFVAHLIKKQKELELEIGMLKSERDESNYKLEKVLKWDDAAKSRFCQIKFYKDQNDKIKSLREKCKNLESENSGLIRKIAQLNLKTNKMKSQRQVEKEYNNLLKDVATEYFYKTELPKMNCYVCGCGHITKTINIDSGVTPFLFDCEKCGEKAKSTFFNDIAPRLKPKFEWYRPTLKQVLKMRKKPAMLEHVLKGGLDFRNLQNH